MLYQLVAVTGQVTKFMLFAFQYVTWFQQTCQKLLTDPCAVSLIRLMTGHIFDMVGVHNPDFHTETFKNLIGRFPVNTGTFTVTWVMALDNNYSFNPIKELLKVFQLRVPVLRSLPLIVVIIRPCGYLFHNLGESLA